MTNKQTIERLVDRADAAYIYGQATEEQYDSWTVALNAWAEEQYRKIAVAALKVE